MKKILISAMALFAFALIQNTQAQRSFVDLNFGYSSYEQSGEVLGQTVKTDLSVINITAGYNFSIAKDLYLGAMLGYSNISADKDDDGVSLFTVTPKLTYTMALTPKISWTPNFYVTFGFGKTDLGTAPVVGDLGDINKLNVRIGLSPLSFDYAVTNNLSINLTALTPYYNIMKYSYSKKESMNFTAKDFVFLGGQIGVKFYL